MEELKQTTDGKWLITNDKSMMFPPLDIKIKIKQNFEPFVNVENVVNGTEKVDGKPYSWTDFIKKEPHADIKLIEEGDWIDCYASQEITLQKGERKLIPLGFMAKLPKGCEGWLIFRSSTPKNFGIIMANSKGIIDQPYCGNNDEWKFNAFAIRDTTIHIGDRIAQFRISLSQKATYAEKVDWLFSNGVAIKFVNEMNSADRGGFGHTGSSVLVDDFKQK